MQPAIDTILLELTRKCIRNCRHCAVVASPAALDASDVIGPPLIAQAGKLGIKRLDITGGEPLLSHAFLPVLQAARTEGIRIGVCATTGELLTELMLDKIERHAGSLPTFSISLDGIDPASHEFLRGEGGYEKTVRAIHAVGSRGGEVWIVTILHKANCRQLVEMLDWIEARPWIRKWKIAVCRPSGRAAGLLSDELPDDSVAATWGLVNRVQQAQPRVTVKIADLFKYNWIELDQRYGLEDHPCSYLAGVVTITADGHVFTCPPGADSGESVFVLGHLIKKSLKEIVESDAYERFWNLRISELSACNRCSLVEICGGGCRANAVLHGQTIKGCDPVASNRARHLAARIR